MGIFGIKDAITGYLLVGMVGLCVLFGAYFWYAQGQIKTLSADVVVAKEANATLSLSIEKIISDQAMILERTNELTDKLSKIRIETTEKKNVIRNRDLKGLASKPKELDNTINQGLRDWHKRMEEISK